MASTFYSVEFAVVGGPWTVSRVFDTKRAAMKWGRWISRHGSTRVMQGGSGGMLVATF